MVSIEITENTKSSVFKNCYQKQFSKSGTEPNQTGPKLPTMLQKIVTTQHGKKKKKTTKKGKKKGKPENSKTQKTVQPNNPKATQKRKNTEDSEEPITNVLLCSYFFLTKSQKPNRVVTRERDAYHPEVRNDEILIDEEWTGYKLRMVEVMMTSISKIESRK